MDHERKPSAAARMMSEECIAVRLRLLTRAVTRLYNRALRPHGLTVSQMNILVTVCRLGQAKQQAICDLLQLEKSSLSRDIVRMRSRGWLKSVPGEDGRMVLLIATPSGERLLDVILPAWEVAQGEAKALLRKEGLTGLQKAVTSLRAEKSS